MLAEAIEMYRSHNCGELRISDLTKQVELSGWIQKIRDKGFIMWVDLRDRYGITQLIFDQERTSAQELSDHFVKQVEIRSNKKEIEKFMLVHDSMTRALPFIKAILYTKF